jgi:hypothetical protein
MRAVAPDALLHGAGEIRLAPAPDAGLVVGRDVGRHDAAEGRLQGQAPGHGLPVGPMVWQATQSPITASARPRSMPGEIVGRRIGHRCRAAGPCRAAAVETRVTLAARGAHLRTSGWPGFFRYWSRIASTIMQHSAPTVPVGL